LIQTIIPTSRVKKVIEIAFEEARKMNARDIDTGHMLMALVIEGDGIAAHVLEDLGATNERVVTEVQRELGAAVTPRPRLAEQPIVHDPAWIIGRSTHIRTPVQDLVRLLDSPPIAKQLKARGLDTEALLKQLREPPAKLTVLRNALKTAQGALDAALREQQSVVQIARLQNSVDGLYEMLVNTEQEWLDSLH
jgi:ATP-dependent Clp protease ATP-binding subunit ClpA